LKEVVGMTTIWKWEVFRDDQTTIGLVPGHGVEVSLSNVDFLLAFIDGFSWLDKWGLEKSGLVEIYLNKKCHDWPEPILHGLRAAVLRFLVEQRYQESDLDLEGYHLHINA
jgi:hypothetical protein